MNLKTSNNRNGVNISLINFLWWTITVALLTWLSKFTSLGESPWFIIALLVFLLFQALLYWFLLRLIFPKKKNLTKAVTMPLLILVGYFFFIFIVFILRAPHLN